MISRNKNAYEYKFVEHGLKVLHIDQFIGEDEIEGKVKFCTCDIWILKSKAEEKTEDKLEEEDMEDTN